MTRPLHLRPSAILLVAAGGAVGTAARAAIGAALPPLGVVPVATLAGPAWGTASARRRSPSRRPPRASR
ncbi:hypothetical protein [Rathayibacter sp. AY1H3]|uniref:hypothetical protein n=1 Tax=Rathayibacter sp. AY1H3 TaxID=2080567 RepID=UPI000CE7AC2E|nr:hypothetical protein [Rathayibacter sp. AY1H3]PPH08130.1 hypothetical protein C5C33_05835 [Rathayibacter sp. AY1H3]